MRTRVLQRQCLAVRLACGCEGRGLAGGRSADEGIRQKVRLQIGQATEQLATTTRDFLSPHCSVNGLPSLSPGIELNIQNHPDELVLCLRGEKNYRRAFVVLRWTLRLWYGLWNRDLRVVVTAIPPRVLASPLSSAEPLCLDIRWRIEGRPRFGLTDGRPRALLSGYSHYYFEGETGTVRKHVIDRLVPPTVRGSLLWWYLERQRWPGSDLPKPIVPTDKPRKAL